MNWISVNDHVPAHSRNVLVRFTERGLNRIEVARFIGWDTAIGPVWESGAEYPGRRVLYSVTHWAELLKEPEGT